jgi:hypothetical protein
MKKNTRWLVVSTIFLLLVSPCINAQKNDSIIIPGVPYKLFWEIALKKVLDKGFGNP